MTTKSKRFALIVIDTDGTVSFMTDSHVYIDDPFGEGSVILYRSLRDAEETADCLRFLNKGRVKSIIVARYPYKSRAMTIRKRAR